PGLERVQHECVGDVPGDDAVGRPLDRAGEPRRQEPEAPVGARGGLLDQSQRSDVLGMGPLPAEVERLTRALREEAIERAPRYGFLAEAVGFSSEGASTAPSDASPRRDCAGGAGARTEATSS